jgi:hypothetical protein
LANLDTPTWDGEEPQYEGHEYGNGAHLWAQGQASSASITWSPGEPLSTLLVHESGARPAVELPGGIRLDPSPVATWQGVRLESFTLKAVLAADLTGDGVMELITRSESTRSHASYVRAWARDGTLLVSYLNPGFVRCIVPIDVDGDGDNELVLGGLHVGLGRRRPGRARDEIGQPIAVVLDVPSPPGQAPHGDSGERFAGVPLAAPRFAVRLPSSVIFRELMERPEVNHLERRKGGGFIAHVLQRSLDPAGATPAVHYEVTADGDLAACHVDSGVVTQLAYFRRQQELIGARSIPEPGVAEDAAGSCNAWGRRSRAR